MASGALSIVLDTHVLVWLVEGSRRMGERCRKALDKSLQEDALNVSAIVFWEIATLRKKGRLELAGDLPAWRAELLGMGVKEVPVTGLIGLRAAELEAFHGNPADRLIVATALDIGARLCTADQQILDWLPRQSRRDARR